MKKNIPAVSIVIPMYNAEKYICECLDSILAQTFQDYEVIIVDDGSTDNSCAVVESYLPKFNKRGEGGGKLQLYKLDHNSGTPNAPRNMAMRISCGEYLMFLDADDAITKTALEEIYPIAKKFDADVIHCERHFAAPANTVNMDKKVFKIASIMPTDFVTVPTPMSASKTERIALFSTGKFTWTTYTNFVRRKLVMKNKIEFPNIKMGGDFVFTIKLLCLAESFIIIPNIYYIYRQLIDSVSRFGNQTNIDKLVKHVGALTFKGISVIDNFLNEFKEFRDNPGYKYALYEHLIAHNPTFLRIYAQIPAHKLDTLIKAELSDEQNIIPLTSFLFARMNIFNLQLIQAQQIIAQKDAQISELKKQL